MSHGLITSTRQWSDGPAAHPRINLHPAFSLTFVLGSTDTDTLYRRNGA